MAYEDQWREELKKDLAVDEVAIEKDYGNKKAEDLSGMAGMMKLVESLMGGDSAKAKSSKNNRIAHRVHRGRDRDRRKHDQPIRRFVGWLRHDPPLVAPGRS